MKKYNCESCNFHTDHKPNYLRHLRTSKHNKSSKSHQLVTPKSPISHQLYNNMYLENFKPFTCHYCNKGFNFKQGMYRHIKYTCRKNKDEDFKELARLLNEKEKQMKDKDKKLDNLLKQISKLTNKLQIQNINMIINQTLPENAETQEVIIPFSKTLNIYELLEKTKERMGKSFYPYQANSWNCQHFIWNILQANDLGNSQNKTSILPA